MLFDESSSWTAPIWCFFKTQIFDLYAWLPLRSTSKFSLVNMTGAFFLRSPSLSTILGSLWQAERQAISLYHFSISLASHPMHEKFHFAYSHMGFAEFFIKWSIKIILHVWTYSTFFYVKFNANVIGVYNKIFVAKEIYEKYDSFPPNL